MFENTHVLAIPITAPILREIAAISEEKDLISKSLAASEEDNQVCVLLEVTHSSYTVSRIHTTPEWKSPQKKKWGSSVRGVFHFFFWGGGLPSGREFIF